MSGLRLPSSSVYPPSAQLLTPWSLPADSGLFPSWACGVILFTLLAGSPPFWHRRQILMLRMIMEGQYQFSSPEWDDRSDTVKDLVSWGCERAGRAAPELALTPPAPP